MKTVRLSHVALPALLTSLVAAASAQRFLPPRLDAFVERVRKQYDVPGISLAIVKTGGVVLTRGYAVRKLGFPAAVDEGTVFAIASNTKAFTATALGLLVEEGAIEWDAPVVRYLPWFRLSDAYVTAELTVRDLLVHRSGLGAGVLPANPRSGLRTWP